MVFSPQKSQAPSLYGVTLSSFANIIDLGSSDFVYREHAILKYNLLFVLGLVNPYFLGVFE